MSDPQSSRPEAPRGRLGEPCPHDWNHSTPTLDMAPLGIHTRWCRMCGLIQEWGPELEPWRDIRTMTADQLTSARMTWA